MKARLATILGDACPPVDVVPNAVNSMVVRAAPDPAIATSIEAARGSADLLLCYPTRPYPHKNLDFLSGLASELAACGILARFVVTLRESEWGSQRATLRDVCINLGEVRIDQISTVMRSCDGLVFPSLLEAYSVTPIEAMALGVPVFASDRDFVRSVCHDAAVYFDPTDPSTAAATIASSLSPDELHRRVQLGIGVVAQAPTATERAEKYLSILTDEEGQLS